MKKFQKVGNAAVFMFSHLRDLDMDWRIILKRIFWDVTLRHWVGVPNDLTILVP
jgi:hypothetical protein